MTLTVFPLTIFQLTLWFHREAVQPLMRGWGWVWGGVGTGRAFYRVPCHKGLEPLSQLAPVCQISEFTEADEMRILSQ